MTRSANWRRTLVGFLSAVAFCIWAPTFAFAEGDPLAGGRTKLALRGGLEKSLRRNDVKIRGIGSARMRGGTLTMPVEGGELDPTTGLGMVLHMGGVAFRHHGRAVSFGDLALDTTTRTMTAKVGGKRAVFALARRISFVRDGLGVRVTISRLRLSGGAAKRLNARLGLAGLFRGRQLLGAGSTLSQPASVKLVPVQGPHDPAYSFGFLFFAPDKNALAKFEAKDVFYSNPGCVSNCPLPTFGLINGPPILASSMIFYITGGRMAVDGSSGALTTVDQVGIRSSDPANPSRMLIDRIAFDLTSKTASAEVELQPQPQEPGTLGRVRIADIETSASVLGPAEAGTSGTGIARPSANGRGTAFLGQAEAAILNQMFPGPPAADFVAGDVLGSFSFHAGIR